MTAETTVKDENIVWHQHSVDKQFRAELKKQKPAVLWFTGLSGAGKSTVAGALENRLAALAFLNRIAARIFVVLVNWLN